MKKRLHATFLLIVLVPLAALAYLGVRLARDEEALVRHQLAAAHVARLGDLEALVSGVLADIERSLLQRTEAPRETGSDRAPGSPGAGLAADPESLRALVRRDPLLRQAFLLSADGRLLFPTAQEGSDVERDFLVRTRAIWSGDAVLYGERASEGVAAPPRERAVPGRGDSVVDLAKNAGHGWIAWYWEEGPQLLFWRRRPDGGIVGVELERVALFSRLIGRLPSAETDAAGGRVVLADHRGEILYQWGAELPAASAAAPDARLDLGPPLDFLQLRFHAPAGEVDAFFGGAVRLNLAGGLLAAALTVLGLAIYFRREYTRDLADAAERVTFVTRVSHELKTPLTNIRLYAELLEAELEDAGGEAGRRLQVIVSESQRLSRLIGNILTFSRRSRGALELHRSPVVIDDVIRAVLEQFAPSLEAKHLRVSFTAGAPGVILADGDAVGQIVGNLIGNVEKYAASGEALLIDSRQTPGEVVVTVRDLGPGIPREHAELIFEPFYRASDRLADGATGTGIGLTIARELARAHGGELVLRPSDRGAVFELTLSGGVEEDG